MPSFILHPTLKNDTFHIAEWKLCDVLLMNNRLFPWIILVPHVANASEITDLNQTQQQQLMQEITQASRILQDETGAEKMNVAALGNVVAQLHIHVIARFRHDCAWPKPVWGEGGEAYSQPEADDLVARLREILIPPANNE